MDATDNERNVVMLIDDDEVSLTMGREILENKYTLYPVPSGEQAFMILKKVTPDLILLDLEMPGMDGYAVLKKLKQEDATKDIPVIFLTSSTSPVDELEGLRLGAIDFVTKPFSPLLLVQRIENNLKLCSQKFTHCNYDLQKMAREQEEKAIRFQNAVLGALSQIASRKDQRDDGHIGRIQGYLQKMLDAMLKQGPYKEEVESLEPAAFIGAAQMYDAGKIYVREAILNKPGKLDGDEFNEIKQHPACGLTIIDSIRKRLADVPLLLYYAAAFAESHHERWDGSGYPAGLKGENIPLAGRLMALADTYDALITARPYKQAMEHRDATKEIIQGAGTAFDPALVEVFKTVSDGFAEVAKQQDG